MDSKELVKLMKEDVKDARKKNIIQFSIEAIDAWVNSLEVLVKKFPNSEPTYNQKETRKMEWEGELAYYNAQSQHALEGYRSVIQLGLMALKSSILINGGAVIALLAFIGHIWDSKLFQTIQITITDSLFFFFKGVLVAAVATAIGYFTQVCYVDFGKRTLAEIFRVITILLVLSSYFFFYQGGSQALEAFETPLKKETRGVGKGES